MRLAEMRRKQRVADRWYPEWGTGMVEEVRATRVLIRFPAGIKIYDAEHTQFLDQL